MFLLRLFAFCEHDDALAQIVVGNSRRRSGKGQKTCGSHAGEGVCLQTPKLARLVQDIIESRVAAQTKRIKATRGQGGGTRCYSIGNGGGEK